MPKFLLQIVGPAEPSDDSKGRSLTETLKLHEEFMASLDAAPGVELLASEALDFVSTATFLRATCSPDVDVFDNPYPELKEALGGFYLISAQSEEQAVQLATATQLGEPMSRRRADRARRDRAATGEGVRSDGPHARVAAARAVIEMPDVAAVDERLPAVPHRLARLLPRPHRRSR